MLKSRTNNAVAWVLWQKATTKVSTGGGHWCQPLARSRSSRSSFLCWPNVRLAHSWSKVSPRDFASLEDQIYSAGSKVVDPVLQESLGSLKWLQRAIEVDKDDDDKDATVTLQVPSLFHPNITDLKERLSQVATEELEKWKLDHPKVDLLPNVGIKVEASTMRPIPSMARYLENQEEIASQLGPGLANVSQYLAVYSCKGGVGKSTVAVNLAYEMARLGGRIGILDLDIYGPSLPILVKPDDPAVRPSPTGKGMVYPVEHQGVKLLSLGYVSPKSGVPGSGPDAGAAVMRGPMAGRVVTQLLKATDWGDLDVLILDLPPGTGDVQLAVCQELQLTGAVAVTTPSKLATEDTRKGIEMFTSLGVPTLAVVENMGYFVCEGGSKHYPFGQGLQFPTGNLSPASTVQLPISSVTNAANDLGQPLVLTRHVDALEELGAFEELAKTVSRELFLLQNKSSDSAGLISIDGAEFEVETLRCSMDQGNDAFIVRLYSDSGATQIKISASSLRAREPKTGEILPGHTAAAEEIKESNQPSDSMVKVHKVSSTKKDVRYTPTRIEMKGRYGYAVEWEDGATIIYSMLTIAKAAAACAALNKQ